jgi:hypothetical protein
VKVLKKVSLASVMSLIWVISTPGTVHAWTYFRSMPATACMVQPDQSNDFGISTVYILNKISSDRNIYCPVVSDSYLPSPNITTIDVYGYDGSSIGDIRAKECYQLDNGGPFSMMQCSGAMGVGQVTGAVSFTLGQVGVPGTAVYNLQNFHSGYTHNIVVTLPGTSYFYSIVYRYN